MVKDPTEVCFFKAWNTTRLGLMQHSENLPWIRRLWWYWNLHCLLILIIARFSLWAALSSMNHIHLWKPQCHLWFQVSMLMVLKHFSDRVLTENFMPLFPCVNTKCKSSSVDTAGFWNFLWDFCKELGHIQAVMVNQLFHWRCASLRFRQRSTSTTTETSCVPQNFSQFLQSTIVKVLHLQFIVTDFPKNGG